MDDRLGQLRSGLLGDRVADELERDHRAETTDIADLRPARLPGEQAGAQRVTEDLRPRNELLLLEDVEHRARCSQRDGIADERAADRARVRVVHDRCAADHAGQRQATGDRLRDDHQVRLHLEVLHREHATRPPEAGLHLVGDEDDPVFVANPAQALDELFRGRDEPSLPLLRLEDNRSDVIRRDLGDEHPLERGDRRIGSEPAVRGSGTARGRPRARTDPSPFLYGWVLDVIVSAIHVRPWNAPSNAITPWRFV